MRTQPISFAQAVSTQVHRGGAWVLGTTELLDLKGGVWEGNRSTDWSLYEYTEAVPGC
jgi:hypothetical protein